MEMNEKNERKGREGWEEEGKRRRGGGDALGHDTIFPWSRALTPLRRNRTRYRVIQGQEVS